ncbi:uncharacterized protein [Haliotis cracherodii]|uniref:uncharacterized protein n=1 Tax=Haliotis cracherodii TaxID=6455 RepID=UPI0039ED2A9D
MPYEDLRVTRGVRNKHLTLYFSSTGSGIVQYIRWQHAQAALAAGPHFIMKKQIIVSDKKDADPRKSGKVMDALQKHKLYVTNIPTDVTQDELFEYFSQWGNIFSCDIVESKKGDNNFGFVSYTDEEDALKCLKGTHNFRDKRMYVRVSDKSKSMSEAVQDPKKILAAVSSLKSLGKNKLFVSNIPTGVTSDELFEHFSMWGKVDACSLGGHIGPNNNYGFVSYNNDDDALKCLNVPHTLQKRRLFVRESDQGKNLTKAATDPKKVQEKNEKCQLFVTNVPVGTTLEEVYDHFVNWGDLANYILRPTATNKLIAFVTYVNEADALRCLDAVHTLNGSQLFMRLSNVSKGMQEPLRASDSRKSDVTQDAAARPATSPQDAPAVPARSPQDAPARPARSPQDAPAMPARYPQDAPAVPARYPQGAPAMPARYPQDAPAILARSPWDAPARPARSPQDAPAVPARSPWDAPAVPARSPWDAPARPARSPQDAPAIPARSPWDAPAGPARSPWDAPAVPARSPWDAPARPARSPQDAPARPARSPQDAPAVPARSPWDGPAVPARSPWDAPARPARSPQDAPAVPARSARPTSPVPPIADPPTRKLSISGLTTRTSNDHLLYYFSQWGSIEDFELEKDTTGRPTGCAFVVFERQCDAETAVSTKPHIIDRKEIKVTYTKPPKKQPSETFPSWREGGHSETVHRPRLPETVKLQRLHEVDHPKYALEQQRLPEDVGSQSLPESFQSRRLPQNLKTGRLPDNVQSRRLPEDFHSRLIPEDIQSRRKPETVNSQRLPEVYHPEDAMEPQRLHEDSAVSQRLAENVQSRRLPGAFPSKWMPKDLQPQRLGEVFQPSMLPISQSTPESLIPGLKQAEVVPDSLPPPQTLGTEYNCNVSGCFYRGTSLQFERHWTERHEAKVIYLICSFCTMGCVDTDDLCEHLDFFHGVEDKIELSKFLQEAKREERDNIHYVMPGSVTKESCMRVAKPARHEPTRLKLPPQQTTDARDVIKCTECTFTGTMDEYFKKKEPDDLEADFDEYQNFNVSSSQHETGYHKFQREVDRSQTHIQTILGMSSGMSARSSQSGNLSIQTKPTASSSAPLQSGQNVPRPNLVPSLPTQQPVPRLDPPPLATHVPLTPQQHIQSQPTIVSAPQLSYRHLVPPTNTHSQPAVTLHGLVSSYNLSTSSIPEPVPPPPFYPSTASIPKPVPPPLRHSVPLVSSSQPAVASQLYPPAYPQPSDSGIPNTYTKETAVVASRPVVGAQPHIVSPVSYSQASFQPQVSAQSHQSPIMAPSQSQFGATVTSSVGPQTFPQAGDQPQLPLTGQVISQSLQHGSAPQPVQPQMSPPEVLMKQPPVDSQSVNMPSADSSTTPPLDPLDLIIIYKGFQKNQETAAEDVQEKATEDIQEKASKQEQSQSEPEKVIDTKAFDELKKSVQPGSVLALRPDWTKTLKVTRPKTTPLDKTNSVKENRFTPPSKVIPKFDRTDSDNVRKFLLWSHIMMKRLEDANIKVRRRLEAEGDGDDDDDDGGDDGDGDGEEPKEILEWSSDEETNGRNVNTKVKATLSQSHENMKARAHTIAQKVVKDYRNQQLEGKTTNTKGQSKKGKGKLGSVDNKVLGKLLQKSIGMVKYQSKSSNVDADLIKKGMSWAKQKIIYLLKHDEKMIPTDIEEESRGTGFHQRTNNRSRSMEDHQQRTDNRGRLRENLHQRTDNRGRSREDHQQRTDNRGRSREDHQQRKGNRGRSSVGAEQRTDNHGQSTQEFQNRRDWNAEDVEVYVDEYGNEDEEYALAYVDEDGVHVMDDSFVMGEGGPVKKGERMDEIDDMYYGIYQGSRSDRIRGEPRSHGQRGYGGGETRSGHRNLDERDVQIYDRGQEGYIEDRFSEEEYLEYGEDDRISFSSRRNSSHSMRRNDDRRSQRFEDQILRDSVLD